MEDDKKPLELECRELRDESLFGGWLGRNMELVKYTKPASADLTETILPYEPINRMGTQQKDGSTLVKYHWQADQAEGANPPNELMKNSMKAAFAEFERVGNIHFVEAKADEPADLTVAGKTFPQNITPDGKDETSAGEYEHVGKRITLSNSVFDDQCRAPTSPTQEQLRIARHELLHRAGFGHPAPYNDHGGQWGSQCRLPDTLDNIAQTDLSYRYTNKHGDYLGAIDRAALMAVYGQSRQGDVVVRETKGDRLPIKNNMLMSVMEKDPVPLTLRGSLSITDADPEIVSPSFVKGELSDIPSIIKR